MAELSEIQKNILNISTLAEGFLWAARAYGERPAFHYEEGPIRKELTRGKFIGLAGAVARLLLAKGVKNSDRVAIISPARIEWCLAFAGAALSGAIVVPVNETAPEAEQRAILKDAGPKIIFVSANTQGLPALSAAKDAMLISFDSEEFGDALSVSCEAGPPVKNPDEPAVLLYTSGTTGMPKGVMLTHGNLISDVIVILETGLVGVDENLLLALPLYHAYPLVVSFIAPFFAGAEVTMLSNIKDLLRVARERRITILVAVPQMLELMAKGLSSKVPAPFRPLLSACGFVRRQTGFNLGKLIFKSAHKAFGGRLNLLASGGARLRPEVMERLEAFGFTVLEGYGLTETSPVAAFNPVEKRKPGSVGKPVSTAGVRIEEGEVLLRGPMVMKGYWNKPEETARVLKEGWFYTGDIGYVDGEGYIFLTGRKKEIIVLANGKNIQPDEIEKHYADSPLIKELGVYEEGGQLKAVVVPDFDFARAQDIANLNEEVRFALNVLSAKLPPYMRLTGFGLSTLPLPRTSLGKIKRYRLREILSAAPREEPDYEFLKNPTAKKASKAIADTLGKDAVIRPEKSLELDLGIDSLKRLELLSALEDVFLAKGGHFPDDFLTGTQTVGDLVRKLQGFDYSQAGPAERAEKAEDGLIVKTIGPFVLALIKSAFKSYFRVQAEGLENLPAPPFIIAPNHASFLDGFIVAAALPAGVMKRLYFQALSKYFTGFPLSSMAGLAHVIPLDQSRLQQAIRRSEAMLEARKALCIFPEGGRTFDGSLMELKRGIANISIHKNAPIVPAWIEGSFRALPRGKALPRPVKITMRIGKPLYPGDYAGAEELLGALREGILRLSRLGV